MTKLEGCREYSEGSGHETRHAWHRYAAAVGLLIVVNEMAPENQS